MSEMHSEQSMNDILSNNRTEYIAEGLKEGTLDFNTITMAEWLQFSFLMLYHGEQPHIEQNVMYGGNVYTLHACVQGVTPNQPLKSIRKKI